MSPDQQPALGTAGADPWGEKGHHRNTSRAWGGAQRPGRLAAEQASSEVDMGQSLFFLNVFMRGTFQVETPARYLVGI